MKKILLTACLLSLLTYTALCSATKFVPLSLSYTVKISNLQFDSLTLDFKTRYPAATWGGVLSKDSVLKLVNNMAEDSTSLNYIFNDDKQFDKVSLAIRSSANPVNNTLPLCYRNGKTDAAFCPDSCNFPTTTLDGTINLTHEDYKKLYEAYKTAHPDATCGGRFDKESMLLILNSLFANSDHLNFRFYYNSEFKNWHYIYWWPR